MPWRLHFNQLLTRAWIRGAVLGCVLVLCSPCQAQLAINFKVPQYFSSAELKAGQTNRLKSLLVGKQAQILAGGLALVSEPWLGRFTPDGETNVTASSPHCFYDGARHVIFSTNRMEVRTGDGQMFLSGEGYLCHVTNFNLIVSNRVRTLIRRDLAATARVSPGLPGTRKTSPAGTNSAAAGTNTFVLVTADEAYFDYHANEAVYRGQVRVEDPPLVMTSDKLIIQRSPTGSVERIVAEQNVVLTNTQDHSRTTGDLAVYGLNSGAETLELSGQPARWTDPQREASGRRMIYVFKDRRLRLAEESQVVLPRAGFNQTDWLGGGLTTRTNTSGTNQPVTIHAQVFDIDLPYSNRLSRTFTASTNVIVVSPSDQSRATADKAVFEEGNGTLALIGRAIWEHQRRVAKADQLFFDRTQQVFRATGSARLRVPVAAYGKQLATATGGASLPATNAPRFLEMASDWYEYRNGFLTFYDRVHGELYEGDKLQAKLDCDWLRLKLSNQVERIEARGTVTVEQLPLASSSGKITTKKFNSEHLLINFYTNGSVSDAVASTNVVMRQAEMRPGATNTIFSWLSAEEVTALFYEHTNQVRELIALRKVHMTRDEKEATGERAVYTATNNTVELTGNPTAKSPPRLWIEKTDKIIWDRNANQVYSGSPVGRASTTSLPTNALPDLNENRPTNASPGQTAPPATARKPRRPNVRPWQ